MAENTKGCKKNYVNFSVTLFSLNIPRSGDNNWNEGFAGLPRIGFRYRKYGRKVFLGVESDTNLDKKKWHDRTAPSRVHFPLFSCVFLLM